MIRVPDAPGGRLIDAWRHRVGTGRLDLAPRRYEAAEPARTHRRLTAQDGRGDLPLVVNRHGISLVELTPVDHETRPGGTSADCSAGR
ncbi:hypothetical protein KEF29_07295 [Streptomyces tuirus]|uniref:Uncharacterized protein n=1 Tax=Streptomyces tuirus TaxID=68278 RepID=A0A941F8I9_9ACTN|nr:hypothetical protein [Streptomyces tuirus]